MKKLLLFIIPILLGWNTTNAQNALAFTGSQWVTIPDNGSLDLQNTYTIEAWVYPTDNSNNTIIDKGNYNYLFQTHPNGTSGLGLYNNVMGWRYSAGSIPTNVWSHVAVTFNVASDEVIFYLNFTIYKK